jgi:hypothetical protein
MIKKNTILKKKPSKPPKPYLISKTHNLWNIWPMFNQEASFPNNLVLNDEIVKKNINLKNLSKQKK